jgi:hypothetical protein
MKFKELKLNINIRNKNLDYSKKLIKRIKINFKKIKSFNFHGSKGMFKKKKHIY